MTSAKAVARPLGAVGGFYAMALDTLVAIPRRPFPIREFLLQAWFVARVSILPTLMLSVPYTVLLVFNLVPGFPLDGGRIARAAAWRITGDRARATRFAATLGQIFAYLLIVWGLVLVVLGRELLNGLWAMALGWLLLQAARGEVVRSAFEGFEAGWAKADEQSNLE